MDEPIPLFGGQRRSISNDFADVLGEYLGAVVPGGFDGLGGRRLPGDGSGPRACP